MQMKIKQATMSLRAKVMIGIASAAAFFSWAGLMLWLQPRPLWLNVVMAFPPFGITLLPILVVGHWLWPDVVPALWH